MSTYFLVGEEFVLKKGEGKQRQQEKVATLIGSSITKQASFSFFCLCTPLIFLQMTPAITKEPRRVWCSALHRQFAGRETATSLWYLWKFVVQPKMLADVKRVYESECAQTLLLLFAVASAITSVTTAILAYFNFVAALDEV